MKKNIFLSFVPIVVFCAGCAHVQEAGKKVWGSSIAHLEAARPDGKTEIVPVPLDVCFEKTQALIEDVFEARVPLKDKDKKHMAAMNFKGAVDTTQVGIFFTAVESGSTKVEVASMNPGLAAKVAEAIFAGLKEEVR